MEDPAIPKQRGRRILYFSCATVAFVATSVMYITLPTTPATGVLFVIALAVSAVAFGVVHNLSKRAEEERSKEPESR